jgi:hypothetical protein
MMRAAKTARLRRDTVLMRTAILLHIADEDKEDLIRKYYGVTTGLNGHANMIYQGEPSAMKVGPSRKAYSVSVTW